jgi:hypothetical protein
MAQALPITFNEDLNVRNKFFKNVFDCTNLLNMQQILFYS